jgi:hypothetical protein
MRRCPNLRPLHLAATKSGGLFGTLTSRPSTIKVAGTARAGTARSAAAGTEAVRPARCPAPGLGTTH